MKITVEVSDEELREAVKDAIVRDIVQEAARDVKHYTFESARYGDGMTHHLFTEIRKTTREILKEHIDEITAQAVDAAAVSIEKKGIKKLMQEMTEGTT